VTHGAFMTHVCHVVRLFPLHGVYRFNSLRYPRSWLVRCCHSVEVPISLCSYEIYDSVDNMTNWLSYHASLAHVANPFVLINLTWPIIMFKSD
jgi:hypothetical protein